MKRLTPILSCAALAGVTLVCASAGFSANRVVGGTAIQIQSAPWAVFIRQAAGSTSAFCGGSILDSLHVLTAAHCVYDLSGSMASIKTLTIRAGISNYATPAASDAEQDRGVSSLRVHPAFAWSRTAAPDDVAVLALSAPLDLSGPGVEAANLPAPGTLVPAATQVALAGFGRQSGAGAANGGLYWFTATVDGQGSCGSSASSVVAFNDAVASCASSPTSSVCNGDSGSGLVTADGARTLVGIASAGVAGCGAGSHVIFTAVGAPEILRFIQGDDNPPVAPRPTEGTFVSLTWDGALRAGNRLTCEAGGWEGEPRMTYAFINSQNGEVLQKGPRPTLALTPQQVGATVFCTAFATNDGGTSVASTRTTEPVAAAPRLGILHLAPVTGLRGRTASVRVVLDTGRVSGKFGVCITPLARVGSRVCASRLVTDNGTGGFALTLGLRIKPNAPLGTSRLAIAAVAGPSHAEATALLHVTRA
jgi:hypothetical protein